MNLQTEIARVSRSALYQIEQTVSKDAEFSIWNETWEKIEDRLSFARLLFHVDTRSRPTTKVRNHVENVRTFL